MKPIIIYYSRSGNTEKIALQAKEDLNCEAIKIVPEEAYGNYISACLRVTKEKKAPVVPFATYGMSGINWTMKHLKQLCVNAGIKLPFDSGVFKKGNYEQWITDVKKL